MKAEGLNLATAICRRHENPVTRVALIETRPAANNTYTFGALDFLSDKFATVMNGCRLNQADRVAVILPQSAAAAVAQLATLKLGATVVPLSPSLPLETLQPAIKDSGAKLIIAESAVIGRMKEFIESLTHLETVFVADDLPQNGGRDFWREIDAASSDFITVETTASTPAFVFYQQSASSELKAAVFNHGSLTEHLAAFEINNNLDKSDDLIFWTPLAWASPETLFKMLYPAWYYGCAVVAHAPPVADSSQALSLLARCRITNLFINTDEFHALDHIEPELLRQYDLRIRAITGIGAAFAERNQSWAKLLYTKTTDQRGYDQL